MSFPYDFHFIQYNPTIYYTLKTHIMEVKSQKYPHVSRETEAAGTKYPIA